MPPDRPVTAFADTRASFPATRLSVVEATASEDPALRRDAWDVLVRAYWRPVYAFIRLRWNASPDDAADLAQAFFTHALERDFFDDYDPAKARFRTYLRVCLQRFLSNAHKAQTRQKRGGDVRNVPLDVAGAEAEVAHAAADAAALDEDAFFRREAVRSLFRIAVDDLRTLCETTGRAVRFALFERYDLEDPGAGERPTYAALAAEHGLPVTQVTNHLAWARRELRRIVLERLREVSGTEAEFREEARALLGIETP